jgi:hypothetical protein
VSQRQDGRIRQRRRQIRGAFFGRDPNLDAGSRPARDAVELAPARAFVIAETHESHGKEATARERVHDALGASDRQEHADASRRELGEGHAPTGSVDGAGDFPAHLPVQRLAERKPLPC